MKTLKELEEIKTEAETVSKNLHGLTDEELAQVSGGWVDALERVVRELSSFR